MNAYEIIRVQEVWISNTGIDTNALNPGSAGAGPRNAPIEVIGNYFIMVNIANATCV